MVEFRIALIGGGVIAGAHVAAAKALGGKVRVAAIVDPAEAARRKVAEATGAQAFDSTEAFFAAGARERIADAVMICTPPSVRIPLVSAALQRGLGVFVEKPLAHSVADARALVKLAAEHANLPAVVGYCHRFVPAVLEIRRRIQNGALGTVLRFENTFAGWNPGMKHKWMSDPNISGGGSFIDTGCHSLDLYQYLLGPARIESGVVHREWPDRGESSATVLLRGEGTHRSATGVIQSGWLEPGRFTLAVVGTRGLLHYDYEKPKELLHRPCEGKDEVLPVETHEIRFERQLQAFADKCQGRDPGIEIASFADGLRIAEYVDAAMQRAAVA